MTWVVIDRNNVVYSSWVESCAPSPDEEAEMLARFDYSEDQPSSPTIDDVSQEGFAVTTAPNGEKVAFVVVHNPNPQAPAQGAIVLRYIACRH